MKRLILLLAFIIPTIAGAQTVINIGTGVAESLYGPIYIFSNTSTNTHSWNLSVYHGSELTGAGGFASNLTGISWYKTDTGAYLTPDATFEIYIKHTTTTDFPTGADFNNEVVGATLVYSSTTQTLPRAIGWVDFIFNSPFIWNGTDNIMILTRWVRVGMGTDEVNWQSTSFSPARVSHSFNSSATMGTLYTTGNRPNIKLTLAAQAPEDAGVLSLDSVRGRCPGSVDVYATIRNYGSNAITSLNVDWQIDGVAQTQYVFSGNLASSATIQVLLGSTTYTAGVGHSFTAWTSNPNGVTDTIPGNDTASVQNVMPGLSGTYSVGPAGDFATINAAASALTNNGVCGPVEITIDAGTYNERVVIGAIVNSSPVNSILIRSLALDSTSVIIDQPTSAVGDSNYTVGLNGTKYITFSHLTFSRTGADAFSNCVEMSGDAGEIYFLNNRFVGPAGQTTANTDGSRSGIYNAGNAAWDGLYVRNNNFSGNANGIWTWGYALDYAANIYVEDNVFDTYYVGAFLLYSSDPQVNRNSFTRNIADLAVDYFAISLRYVQGAPQIHKNKIAAITGAYGIRLRESNYNSIDRGVVSNNFVYADTDGAGRGIAIEEGSTGIDVFHNSVNYAGTNATTGRAFFVDGVGTADLRAMNNIFLNSGGGYASYVSSNAAGAFLASDNNCFFSTGATLAFFGSAQATLGNLQAASAMDAASISSDPLFTSATDLHTVAGPLGDAGSSVPAIADDIDGDTRELIHPDIGADEFTIVGIAEAGGKNIFNVYPNPASERFIIDVLTADDDVDLSLIDISGRKIMSRELMGGKNLIDVSELARGIYVLELRSGEKRYMERILVE